MILVLEDDTRLNWGEHINKVRAKAKKALKTNRAVARKKLKRDQKTLKKTVQCNM